MATVLEIKAREKRDTVKIGDTDYPLTRLDALSGQSFVYTLNAQDHIQALEAKGYDEKHSVGKAMSIILIGMPADQRQEMMDMLKNVCHAALPTLPDEILNDLDADEMTGIANVFFDTRQNKPQPNAVNALREAKAMPVPIKKSNGTMKSRASTSTTAKTVTP